MDLRELIDQLDFTEENLREALVSQAKLLFTASKYRVKKLRERLAIEAELSQVQTDAALRLRGSKSDKKVTEAYIKERVAGTKEVIAIKREVDEAKVLEEQAKLLVDAYQSRGSMIKSLVQLMGSEAAGESRLVQTALEHMGIQKLKSRVKSRYPGGGADDSE